jgi:hypothetical protein
MPQRRFPANRLLAVASWAALTSSLSSGRVRANKLVRCQCRSRPLVKNTTLELFVADVREHQRLRLCSAVAMPLARAPLPLRSEKHPAVHLTLAGRQAASEIKQGTGDNG